MGCLRADAFLEAVDALDAGGPADASGRDRHLLVGAVATPDYNACLEVLWDELHRHQPLAPDDIVIAD